MHGQKLLNQASGSGIGNEVNKVCRRIQDVVKTAVLAYYEKFTTIYRFKKVAPEDAAAFNTVVF